MPTKNLEGPNSQHKFTCPSGELSYGQGKKTHSTFSPMTPLSAKLLQSIVDRIMTIQGLELHQYPMLREVWNDYFLQTNERAIIYISNAKVMVPDNYKNPVPLEEYVRELTQDVRNLYVIGSLTHDMFTNDAYQGDQPRM